MRISKIFVLLAGALFALVAVGVGLGGGALLCANTFIRGDDGYYSSVSQQFDSSSYAITSKDLEVNNARGDWMPFNLGTARVKVTGKGPQSMFVGVARQADIDAYLSASAHDEVADLSRSSDDVVYRHHSGDASPASPQSQRFWIAQATGTGTQTVQWDVDNGDWAIVAMNADASSGVRFVASAGINTGAALPIGAGMLVGALLIGALATLLIVLSLQGEERSAKTATPTSAETIPTHATTVLPLQFRGNLDTNISRWLWLVKWLLAIPHLIVLAVLWVVFAAATVVAGFAILFTGRYPRSLFDFNVGVMRWTWRVTFYAFTLGTDRYPPFTIAADDTYPADLSVPYPEHLSQPLVLVKWLLAIPHYLVVSIFGGGLMWWTWCISNDQTRGVAGAGLIGLLVFIAAIVLLFSGRYPRSIFEFVMGMQRWTYRVFVYAALMRDEYPPFRLDNGETDPISEDSPK